MKTEDVAVELKNISFSYDGSTVLEDIILDVKTGDFLGMIGPNGGGKSTLLKLLLGLLKPCSGTIKVFGKSPEQSRPWIGYVPQYLNLDLDFPVNVMDVVLMGRLGQAPLFGSWRSNDRKEAIKALEYVEINDLRNRRFGELSGGQRQRVLIARAIVGSPKLLLLDEPTANVDSHIEKDVYALLKKINETATIILVTHDLGFISSYVNRVACINRKLSCLDSGNITGEALDKVYGTHVEMIHHECGL
jgi:zinc transport system ATP-binding protein